MSSTRSRHSEAHWQRLVERQSVSGLSGAEFCRQNEVKYASFMSWRKRLVKPESTTPSASSPNAFVELTAPVQPVSGGRKDALADATLCVELSLGAGIELRISR